MNIDKFGHHVHKRLRRFDPYDSTKVLVKSATGIYDLQSSKLTGLKSPDNLTDAVNKDYVDNLVNNIIKNNISFDPSRVLTKSINNVFELNSTALKGVRTPTTNDDAVNKQYVDDLLKETVSRNEITSFILSEIVKAKTEVKLYVRDHVKQSLHLNISKSANDSSKLKKHE